jgi:hypothetical protein
MATKHIVVIVAVVLLVAAFLSGYIPEHRLRAKAEMDLEQLRSRILVAEDRVRTSELLGRLLMVKEVTARQDYGHAQQLSSAFFDAVRDETSVTRDAQLRAGLHEAQAKRDAVTAALAKGDAGAVGILHTIELRLRQGLGYPVPGEPASR